MPALIGTFSIWHLLILLLVIVLLFGRGKISELMEDVAKGIKSFKKGMSDDEATGDTKSAEPKVIDQSPGTVDSKQSDKSETH